ncbi:hypothetical protein OB955_23970 [Halobacteria archaeon AArc-m2/3/4]|uniref:Uncharacterized protein n=1 Tax=Natronoglomus mannanivorans TaxID=2979990 RepID=A0AAP2Z4A8_9EURY|nr:hypothetical protein [Halobacteria archaeon AArc-xg1-1]MCU4975744.1 hypothetical protein [Halobacteria archaeon AArc-m2/3/4]
MNKSRYSRRQLLSTGAALSAGSLAGCLGAPGSEESDASDMPPGSGDIRIQSMDEIEEPAGGSDLAGSAGDGKPDWIDAHNMRFRGWYYADEYHPSFPYAREEITLSVANNAGYIVTVTVYDDVGETLYDKNVSGGVSSWLRRQHATTAEIRVIGSVQNEALEIDLTDGVHHEIWLTGGVLTAGYWVGRW